MKEKLNKHILKNGMTLLGEPIEAVESAAFEFMLPAGAAVLPQGCCGASNIIEDWMFRGAGGKDNRALGDALDSLGLHRSSSVSSSHITIAAALEAENLSKAICLYADTILRPLLTDEMFEPARQLAIDSVLAMDDDPRQKVMAKLYEQFYPTPLGRSTLGDVKDLKTLTAAKTKQLIRKNFNLSGTIFAVAGKYDFGSVCRRMEKLFDADVQKSSKSVKPEKKGRRYTHLHNEGAQTHIGLMTRTVKPTDKDYYDARIAVSILSGGMSARLFTEVREKRGLCYAIGARYHSLKEAAGIACYAGTTPQKAQKTIDVIMAEFGRLGEKISKEELDRAKAGLKSLLILQSESSSSRAAGIGHDYYALGRVRSLDEIKNKIEAVTVESVLKFLRKNKFTDFTVVTIGPKEIQISS